MILCDNHSQHSVSKVHLFFVLLLNNITLFIHPHIVYSSSLERHLCFHLLAVMTSAAMSIHAQFFMWTCVFISHGRVPRSGIIGSHANSMFDALRN